MATYHFHAHELIAQLPKDSPHRKPCMDAVKFDLGRTDVVADMAAISRQEFFDIPYQSCLFQTQDKESISLFLARKWEQGILWTAFGRHHDKSEWLLAGISFYIFKDKDGQHQCYGLDNKTGTAIDKDALVSDDFFLSYRVIASAIEVFSCSNVTTIENQPPKFINSLRRNKGKVPFFSYHTLHLTGETARNAHASEQKGTHASPRLHLRRGHIRCYASGKKVWVQSCLVGDKSQGISLHDYSVNLQPAM